MGKIEELHTKLHRSYHKPVPAVPAIHPEEVPERQNEYTRETLIDFKEKEGARAEAERQEAAGMGEGGFFGGFGGGGGGGDGGGESKGEEGGKAGGTEKGADNEDSDTRDVSAVTATSQVAAIVVS